MTGLMWEEDLRDGTSPFVAKCVVDYMVNTRWEDDMSHRTNAGIYKLGNHPGLTASQSAWLTAKVLECDVNFMLWNGCSRSRTFLIVTGLFRNKTELMGPDTKFGGLDHLINTAKEAD